MPSAAAARASHYVVPAVLVVEHARAILAVYIMHALVVDITTPWTAFAHIQITIDATFVGHDALITLM